MINKVDGWKNRIVGSAVVAAGTLMANPHNFRRHGKAQAAAMDGALSELGWIQEVIVNQRTGHLIDGHLRLALALRAGNDTAVPVKYVDLDENEERLALLTLDPIAAMANTDHEQLEALLVNVNTGEAALQELLAGLAEANGLDWGAEQAEDPGPQIDKAEELREKWGIELGQLWQLDEHRVICGDCTDAEVVARVMRGEKAEAVWTDPPYGVAVGDKNKWLNSIGLSNRIEENITGDTLDEHGIIGMLCAAFDNVIPHCAAGAAWYVAAPPGPLHLLFGQVLKDRGIWRQTIQWVKNNATFSPMGVCYHWQAEPIFFGWLPTAGHRWYGGRQQTTVWNIDRPIKSPEHPTMKPIELVERAIENSTLAHEIVCDPFLGSGTTLIACERSGRKCRGIEISPAYVAVTLERWASMTGSTPELT